MNAPSVEAFQCAAEEFCTLSASEEPLTQDDLWRFRELIIRLLFNIAAVEQHAQGVDHDGQRLNDEGYSKAVKRFSDFPFNYYRFVFDPHDFEAKDEPTLGMLSDDLADIYRDLYEGLDNAKNGHIDEACFDWASLYQFHWSRHAVSALAAIESYRTVNGVRVS